MISGFPSGYSFGLFLTGQLDAGDEQLLFSKVLLKPEPRSPMPVRYGGGRGAEPPCVTLQSLCRFQHGVGMAGPGRPKFRPTAVMALVVEPHVEPFVE